MLRSLASMLKSGLSRLRGRRLSSLLVIDMDETTVRVRVLGELEPDWNQEFQWADITRVCFKDEGIFRSDLVFLEINGRDQPVCILTEAQQGPEFMGQLVGRGLFPPGIFKKAITSSDGGIYCWPPRQE